VRHSDLRANHTLARTRTPENTFAHRGTGATRPTTLSADTISEPCQAAHKSGPSRSTVACYPAPPLLVRRNSPATRNAADGTSFSTPHGETLLGHASPCPRSTNRSPGAGCLPIRTTNNGTASYAPTTRPPCLAQGHATQSAWEPEYTERRRCRQSVKPASLRRAEGRE
jgi:hypothetical protein